MYSFFISASISIKNVNFIPKGNLTVKTNITPTQTKQKLDNTTQPSSSDYQKGTNGGYKVNTTTKVLNLASFTRSQYHNVFYFIFMQKLRAGELLNRTHEELVLVRHAVFCFTCLFILIFIIYTF